MLTPSMPMPMPMPMPMLAAAAAGKGGGDGGDGIWGDERRRAVQRLFLSAGRNVPFTILRASDSQGRVTVTLEACSWRTALRIRQRQRRGGGGGEGSGGAGRLETASTSAE